MAGDIKKFSITERFKSFRFAFSGLRHVLKAEHNIYIQIAVAVAAIVLGIVFRIGRMDWIIVILCIGFVLFSEIVNTAIEKLTDKVSPQKNEMAGLIKDISAGAVLVAAITSFVAGLFVFLPYVFSWIKHL